MNAMTDANPLSAEPLGLFTILALIILGFLLQSMPKPAAVRATIALGSPRLVALDPGEAASASRLLGSVAADAMAELERWQ
jgi:hypothetical protein